MAPLRQVAIGPCSRGADVGLGWLRYSSTRHRQPESAAVSRSPLARGRHSGASRSENRRRSSARAAVKPGLLRVRQSCAGRANRRMSDHLEMAMAMSRRLNRVQHRSSIAGAVCTGQARLGSHRIRPPVLETCHPRLPRRRWPYRVGYPLRGASMPPQASGGPWTTTGQGACGLWRDRDSQPGEVRGWDSQQCANQRHAQSMPADRLSANFTTAVAACLGQAPLVPQRRARISSNSRPLAGF